MHKSESVSSPPFLSQPALPFGEFLISMFEGFRAKGVTPCLMRNYEGFPDSNIGRDMDFLISPSQLSNAIRVLGSIPGTRIVGYMEYPSVALVFLSGVSPTPQLRALEIDFTWRLDWKGLQFLDTDAMLHAATRHSAGNLTFSALSSAHEAIISLLTCLLVGGFVKEKYLPKVQRTFAGEKQAIVNALLPQFGPRITAQLVESVVTGNRNNIVACAKPLRASLALRSFMRRPLQSTLAVIRHYAAGFAGHYSPKNLESICILGADGCGKTRVIDALIPMLQCSALVVETNHPKLRSFVTRTKSETSVPLDNPVAGTRARSTSIALPFMCLFEAWWRQVKRRLSLTLRLVESPYHDLAINPRRYGYRAPLWLARLIVNLLPSPDLWILLDASSEEIETRNPHLEPAEAQRQAAAYRTFVETRKTYVVLDARKPPDSLAEEAYIAIVDMLALRTDKILKCRLSEL